MCYVPLNEQKGENHEDVYKYQVFINGSKDIYIYRVSINPVEKNKNKIPKANPKDLTLQAFLLSFFMSIFFLSFACIPACYLCNYIE